jgi:hypothetical protein
MISPTGAWITCYDTGVGHYVNTLYETQDNGQTWQLIYKWGPPSDDQLPTWGFAETLCVLNSSEVWITSPNKYDGQRSTLSRSHDGGHRWDITTTIPYGDVDYLSCTTAEQFYIVIESPMGSGKKQAYGTWTGGTTWKRLYSVHHFTR